MDKFIATIQDHPDQREDATPYYLLHKQGEYVYGTVLMFHGFSATTGQMALLAQYLFENGFNVYQPALCGHYFNKPAKIARNSPPSKLLKPLDVVAQSF